MFDPSSRFRKERRRLFLSIALLLATAARGQNEPGGMEWRSLPLPEGVPQLVGFAQSPDGELFTASADELFIRSPYGDENGWERISELHLPKEDEIVALESVRGPDGLVLLVATSSRLFVVRWGHDASAVNPWDRFRYAFEVAELPHAPTSVSDIHGFADQVVDGGPHPVRAYLETGSGALAPLLVRGGAFEFGGLIEAKAGADLLWAAASDGWSFAWPYTSAVLWTLDPEGRPAGPPLDLADLLAPSRFVRDKVAIQCVWLDRRRSLLFVGTSHGVVVADVKQGSGRRTGRFVPVAGLGLTAVQLIGETAGRLWFVTEERASVAGLQGPLLMEGAVGRRCRNASECASMPLFSTAAEGPDRISNVVQLEDDWVFGEGETGEFWFWSPGRWIKAPGSRTTLRDLSIGDFGGRAVYPPVVMSLLEDGLWYLPPRDESYFQVHAVTPAAGSLKWLAPDPSGQGVWTVTDGSYAATGFGGLSFETPHGSSSSDLGVLGGPRRIRVRSLVLQLSDGRTLWPMSRIGGLLLVSGENLLLADSGHEQKLAWSLPGDVSLEEMLPGGGSSETAWLAIRRQPGRPSQVVRVDVPERLGFGEPPRVEIEATRLGCPANTEAVLVPDSDGNVYFAVARSTEHPRRQAWKAHQISGVFQEAVRTLDFGELPIGETPRLLWLAPDEGIASKDNALFTEKGCVSIPRADLPFDQSEPRLLVAEDRPAGAWRPLFGDGEGNRRFRSAIRSEALPSLPLPSWGGVALTDRVEEGLPGTTSHWGAAFGFELDDPAGTFKRLNRFPPTDGEDPVVLWSPGMALLPELVVWGDGAGDSSRPAALQLLRRNDGDLERHEIQVPLLDSMSVATRVPEAADTSLTRVDFAVSDGSLIALHRFPPHGSWRRQFITAFPRSLTVVDADLGAQSRATGDFSIPNLPHTAQRLRVQVAAAYHRWWVSDFSSAGLTASDGDRGTSFARDGIAELSLRPGRSYSLAITQNDPLTGESIPLKGMPFSVDAAPAGPSAVWYVASTLLAIGLATVTTLAIHTGARRGVAAIVANQYWTLAPADCNLEGRLSETDGKLALSLRSPRESEISEQFRFGAADDWPLPEAAKSALPAGAAGRNVSGTLLVEAPEKLLTKLPLRSLDRFGEDGRWLVTGFVPERFRVPGRPAPDRRLKIVHLVVEEGKSVIEKTVSKRGFRFRSDAVDQLTIQDLVETLADAHVVLIDRPPGRVRFDSIDQLLDAARGRKLRCRLMVVLEEAPRRPGTGAIKQGFFVALASLGIHTISVRVGSGDIGNRFVTEFFGLLLPQPGKEAQNLAECIRASISEVAGDDRRSFELILFGDPSTLVVRTPSYDAFLSHAHEDKEAVMWLQEFLQRRWRIWIRRPRVCLDQDAFEPAELSHVIPGLLAASRHLIVCCSPASSNSQWVRREIRYFLRDHSARELLMCDVGERLHRKDEQAVERMVKEIEDWIDRYGLLRPNLIGAPAKEAREVRELQTAALPLLAAITGIPREKLGRGKRLSPPDRNAEDEDRP